MIMPFRNVFIHRVATLFKMEISSIYHNFSDVSLYSFTFLLLYQISPCANRVSLLTPFAGTYFELPYKIFIIYTGIITSLRHFWLSSNELKMVAISIVWPECFCFSFFAKIPSWPSTKNSSTKISYDLNPVM